MKKDQLLLVTLFLLSALSLSAQSDGPQRRFEGGLVAGFNMSQVDGDLLHGFHKIGVNAGGRVNAVLNERWRIGLELLFSQQGASRGRLDNPASQYDKIRLNFVEAPVLVHFQDWKIQATAGVSYGRLINYEVIDYTGEDATEQIPLRENLFSIVLGGTIFVSDNFGINIYWSKWLNNLRIGDTSTPTPVGGESGKFIGRNVTVRGVYMF
ncbi:MAG: PorT family protein [Phaeodactylibacter sp.]|nr:PorT family protein [Phaeodactylibacter sp.]MCB9275627.1 PorT family protein [Lewinellaceae bacterium]